MTKNSSLNDPIRGQKRSTFRRKLSREAPCWCKNASTASYHFNFLVDVKCTSSYYSYGCEYCTYMCRDAVMRDPSRGTSMRSCLPNRPRITVMFRLVHVNLLHTCGTQMASGICICCCGSISSSGIM